MIKHPQKLIAFPLLTHAGWLDLATPLKYSLFLFITTPRLLYHLIYVSDKHRLPTLLASSNWGNKFFL